MNQKIQQFLLSPWFIGVSVALSYWLGLGSLPLFDLDEGAFTEATREMLESGVFSATYLDGEPRYDKPIFFYWIQALSISAFGFNEWAFRLPSVLAACLWAWAFYRFVSEQFNKEKAQIATLFLVNCLWIALIARSAIADALLNLFLSLTLFDIWRYLKTGEQRYALRLYLWMALGTLTKGPVAVAVPLAVSLLYLICSRSLSKHWRTYFNFKGWALYFAVVSPWIIAVSLEQGLGFFEGFIVEHNLKRFSDTRESHGGSIFYYLAVLPIIILPLTGLLAPLFKRLRSQWQGNIGRFLLLWFAVIFCLFSLSKTQLPHYILNALVPLIILLATVSSLEKNYRWTLLFPALFMLLLVFLPELLAIASDNSKGYDQATLAAWPQAVPSYYRVAALAALALIVLATFAPTLRTWQRLALSGLVLNSFFFTVFIQVIFNLQQQPVQNMVKHTLDHYPGEAVVAYRMHMPSFSVYRQQITQLRAPKRGELALVRIDRVAGLEHKLAQNKQPLQLERLYQSSGLLLVRAVDMDRLEN
ncbi:ArnT family glycosyltransferase [Agaribacterium haliotis]|uniref:ArnT family glycosyltransferase n=1 Tax=Agaribacterium haliotis TaxID=2013869 RepID=UPI000BB57D41|nr:glycosyltransferase family 39 protein [Agaribacterium haliotis]